MSSKDSEDDYIRMGQVPGDHEEIQEEMLEAINSLSELRNTRNTIMTTEERVIVGLLLQYDQQLRSTYNISDDDDGTDDVADDIPSNIYNIWQGVLQSIDALRTMRNRRSAITNREEEVNAQLLTLFERERQRAREVRRLYRLNVTGQSNRAMDAERRLEELMRSTNTPSQASEHNENDAEEEGQIQETDFYN